MAARVRGLSVVTTPTPLGLGRDRIERAFERLGPSPSW